MTPRTPNPLPGQSWHVVGDRGGERFIVGTFGSERTARRRLKVWRAGGIDCVLTVERDQRPTRGTK